MRISSFGHAAINRLPDMAHVLAAVTGCLLFLAGAPASANIIQVAAAASGPGGSQCSLIDAINAANDNKKTGACPAGDDQTNGGDVILLAAGSYKLSSADNDWYGPNGLPAITSKITIIGSPDGTIIMRNSTQGGSAFRIFYIGGGESLTAYNPPADSSGNPIYSALPGPGDLTLENLTLQNGLAQGGDGGKSSSGNGGGGLGAGGAIYNQGKLTLENVTLNGNQAIGGNGGGAATSSTSSGSAGGGGGMSGKGDSFGNGGGFSSNGAWPASSSAPGTFGNGGDSQNSGGVGGGGGAGKNGGFGGGGGGGTTTAGFGGGASVGGTAGFGGGSFVTAVDGGGAGLGGAIFNDGGTLTILNSTLTANNAQGGAGGTDGFASGSGYGGAVFNLNGSVTIRYSTLAANTVTYNQNLINLGSAAAGGAIYSMSQSKPGSPAADAKSTASLTINSSILFYSNQETLSSSGNTSASAIDCINASGSFSGSHNNIGGTSSTCAPGATVTLPPLLLALGNHGGPTQTMQLIGSTDTNAGDTSNAPALDQRGYLRDSQPDIGAFEISSTRVAPPSIAGLQDATVTADTDASLFPFNIAGSTAAPAGLTVSANSSDTSLLPASNIALSSGCGAGTSRATCSLSITPPTDKTGNVTVTVTATDAYGQRGDQSFVLTIIPPPPVASDVSLSTASNQALSGVLKATEALNVQLNYSIVSQPTNGTVKQASAGSSAFTYTANSGFTGTDSFTFQASDGTSDSNIAKVTVTVTAPVAIPGQITASNLKLTAYQNTALTGTLPITGASGAGMTITIGTKPAHGTVTINDPNTGAFTYTPASGYTGTSALSFATYAGTPLNGALAASDAAGNAVSFSITRPSHGTLKLLDASTGTFTYTPATGYTGSDSFTFTATDTVTKLASSAATVSLTVNAIPVSGTAVPLASDASFTTYVDTAVSASVSASDAAGNPLNYVLAQAPAHGTVTITAASGAFVYTPAASYTGKDSFTFTATDSVTGVSSQAATVSLTVNPLPSPANTAPVASNVAIATYKAQAISGAMSASDAGGNPLTYSQTNPAHGTLTVSASTGAFTYTPTSTYTGADSFTYTAKDTVTGLVSAAATVSIVINTDPAAPAAPATEPLGITTYKNVAISGTLPATDALGTQLQFVAATQPGNGTLTVDQSSGAFTYTPKLNYTGTDSFTFTAANTLTGATSSATTVSITVNASPVTPGTPVASDGAAQVYENTPVTGTLIAVDDDTSHILQYAVTGTGPTNGTVSVNQSSGAFTYTPNAGFTGSDSFDFTATDKTTGNPSNQATVTLTVSAAPAAPAAPLASDASYALYENQSLSGTLSAAAAPGDGLSYSVLQPGHGQVTFTAATGAFTYTPDAGYTGSDSFTFTAIDTTINTVSATATVSLSVSPPPTVAVNPLANGATLSLYENQPLNGSLSAVDANGNPLSYAAATQPAHGKISVTVASGAFVYTPDAGYAGKDSFTFIATDTVSKLASSAATITLNVTSPPLANVAPLTSDTAFTLFSGTSLNVTLSAVDANGNAVSYAIGTKPKNGTVTVTAASGAFSYTPTPGYTGTDSFTFTATDTTTKLSSAAATVSLTIAPAPPAPVHHGGPRGGGAFGWLTLVLLAFLTLWRSFPVKSFQFAATFRRFGLAGPILLMLLGHNAAAQDATAAPPIPADQWYIGGQAGIIKPDRKRNASTHGFHSWDLLFGREFGDYSLEFSAAYHADDPRTTNDIASWTSYGANGLWYFRHRDASRFSPFAFGGVGLLNQYRGDNSKVRSQYLALGAGFDSTFGEPTPIRLRADVQLQHAFSGYNDLILSVGLVIPFGGSAPPWQPAALPGQPPLEEYPMAWCTEHGGHPFHSEQGWVCLPAAGSASKGGCESKPTDKSRTAENQKQTCPPR
jgi:hypothetical protein